MSSVQIYGATAVSRAEFVISGEVPTYKLKMQKFSPPH